ncbi:beta-phosphoglucomutase family hydrolase [Marinobacterium sp. D7]|uniref:HAD family hydrolase n=1 Tax=Marinobacterium ramblicola TaxID=2849041 RepID=UPI001C2D200E|nr:beta-phosphoglucomutase family hydrolase [Marinobacterium ramblicola]MBV1787692.1 beta-phosphoglucomutase family hydrolase [Marinobacterium ramblicola]
MIDLQKYAGIVFDMDGTLVDTMEGHLESWRLTCEAYGFPFDKAYLHGLGGVPSVRTVEMLNELHGLSHDAEEVAEHKYRTWRSMKPDPQLIPETLGVFRHYRASKKIGVGTGAKRESAEIILNAVGLIDQLDALVTSSDVEQGKPHPDTFLKVAELMGVNPSDCVVFEDTEIGRQAAAAAGMDCFLFSDGEFRFYPSE